MKYNSIFQPCRNEDATAFDASHLRNASSAIHHGTVKSIIILACLPAFKRVYAEFDERFVKEAMQVRLSCTAAFTLLDSPVLSYLHANDEVVPKH